MIHQLIKLFLPYSNFQYKVILSLELFLLSVFLWVILKRTIMRKVKEESRLRFRKRLALFFCIAFGAVAIGWVWMSGFQSFPEVLSILVSYLKYKIALSIFILILTLIFRYILSKIIDQRVKDIRKHYYWKRIAGYATTILGIIIIGLIWIRGIGQLATFFGLVSAGVALSLRDLIANFAGWLFIIWRQPFRVGDRIEIGSFQGDVIDVRIFHFSILEIGNWVENDQSTGRIIDIPNGMVLNQGIGNYTKDFEYIWNEIRVLITFESDWKKAKAILQKIAQEKAEHLSPDATHQIRAAAKKYMIFYHHLTPIVYTDVKDYGVNLTIRYMTKPRQRRSTTQAIWEAILDEFSKQPDITLAYPTTRFYNALREGRIGQSDGKEN